MLPVLGEDAAQNSMEPVVIALVWHDRIIPAGDVRETKSERYVVDDGQRLTRAALARLSRLRRAHTQ